MKYKHKVRVNSSTESENVKTFLADNGFLKPYGNFILLDGWVCIDEFKNILCVAKSQAGKECDDYKTVSFDELKAIVKPKEYLFKGIGGEYRVVNHDCKGRAIEIPEGAEYLTECMDKGVVFRLFWKGNYKICVGFDEDWYDIGYDVNEYKNDPHYNSPSIVWQRHTKPEELPFVDDGLTDATAFIQSNMDQVNHPSHYASGAIECIDAIESSMTKEAFAGYLKGNVQKYMWRYEKKGGVESLQKAQWYLNRLILLQSA